jgi:V/A-type H+-transporting ATPase subunit I
MIIDVKKYLIMGVKEEIDHFFSVAQQQGIVEFIPPHAKKKIELPLEIQHLLSAMKVLRKLPLKKPYEGEEDLALADETALRILDLKAEVERLAEEKRLLELEILRVTPLGDFSLEDIDFIEKEGKLHLQFFCNKSIKTPLIPLQEGMIYLSTDYDLDYFLAINKEPIASHERIEMRIDRPLGELQTHLGFIRESLHQLEAELKGYAGHYEFLHEFLLQRLNDFHLTTAKKELSFPLENTLFAVEAWVPANKLTALYSFIDGMAVHCEEISVEEQDRVPTYMENKGVPLIGEGLVKIYDIPAPKDNDPSPWVFWAFVLFFSIVVNDGGYGLLYLALCLFCKLRFPHMKSGARRFLKMATILSIGCIVWGVLTAAFFGLQVQPKSWLEKISVLHYVVVKKADYHVEKKDEVYKLWISRFPQLKSVSSGAEFLEKGATTKGNHLEYEIQQEFSRSIFLEFSLMIGVIHIALSLLRNLWRHWAGAGWVVFMAGGYLYFPSILKATSMIYFLGLIDKQEATAVGIQVIYTGIIAAIALSLLQKRLKGIGEISTLIQIFADVLSYLRLYALGLSTAIMAETFNTLGKEVGLFLGILIIIAGHAIAILMGLMTGTIHGLRLNFIEWYHYSFQGGGRLLRPLMRLKSKEHT